MKIVDTVTPPSKLNLDTAEEGSVIRLKNRRVYLIGSRVGPFLDRQRVLINLETGKTHDIGNGKGTTCVAVNAVLNVVGDNE